MTEEEARTFMEGVVEPALTRVIEPVWTALGELNERLDALQNRVDTLHQAHGELRQQTERGFVQTNLRLAAVETRLAAIENRISDGEADPYPQETTTAP